MTQHHTILRNYLECYGSDMEAWPQDARQWAQHALEGNPALQAMIDEEKTFEAHLLTRHFTPARADLAQRIVMASRSHKVPATPAGVLPGYMIPTSVLSYFRPTAFAAMLVLGFTLGFNAFHPAATEGTASMQSYTDDEGAIL